MAIALQKDWLETENLQKTVAIKPIENTSYTLRGH